MKFILTRELGRLVKWLRILGFDTAYFNQDNYSSLVIQALKDDRIILTRNHRLLKPGRVKTTLIKAEEIKEQVLEVLKELKIKPDPDIMFSRCIICNVELKGIDKGEVKNRVPEYVFKTQEDFITCPNCNRVYWKGTHWGNVKKTLEEISQTN